MRRLFGLPWRSERAIREDLEEELRFHLEARAEDLVAEGMTPEEARAQATREFGDIEDARRYIRSLDRSAEAERRRRDVMGDLRQDLVYAVRKLRSSPAFTVTAVVTLTLGIGANTAIFSVVNSVLFRPLPYPQPGQLYRVWSASRSSQRTTVPVSSPDIEDWRARRQQIADLGGYWYADGGSGLDFTGDGEPRRLQGAFVTAGFFSTFGVPAARGRLPREDEMVRGGHDHVVVLSWGFWQRQFGGDPAVLGSALTLGGEPYDVLGVMPADFRFPANRIDVYVPYSAIPDHSIPHIRAVRVLQVVARARPGVTQGAVQAEMNTIATRLAAQYSEDDPYDGTTVRPLQDVITGPVRAGLLVLLGAVGFVLLITCVNVAGLLLARASTRAREIATRIALGASRGRIARQLLTESMVLALVGGLAGLGLARLIVDGLLRLSSGQLPRGSEVSLDGTVLLFGLGITLATGVLFGLVPALRGSSGGMRGALREGGRGSAGGESTRLRDGLVIVEVALAVILVAAAGLMTRSLVELLHVDPGFRPDHLLAANFTISTERQGESYGPFYERVIDKVRSLPGVVSAGAVKDAPFRGAGERWGFTTEGMTVPAGEEGPSAMVLHVSDGYFHTIGARILDGREFTPQDRADAPPVFVVNEALAMQYFPGQQAVGKAIFIGEDHPVTIVGVVADIRQSAMDEPAQPTIYVDNLQDTRVKVTLVARTAGDPLALAGPLREAIWSIDPNQTITSIFTFDDIVSEAVARPRLLTVLLGSFGVLGLILGALGIYGVLAYLVGHRQREIGLRLALGARPGAVERMVVGRGLLLSSIGVALGLVGAFGLTRYIQGVLFGVAPTDPITFVGVALVLVTTAALASWAPARRAAAVDPVAALRAE
ncbi:MAG: ABC transporter permease [Gemmatimonadetes bacterium]|nr:ABC transporter permease [Gemmatimonadota bacterium]